jgi:4-amino-4-deoxy-L-arabinose transferase-like glycosyltransferase
VAYGAVALLLAVVFVPMGFVRLVDADEGIYLLNARMTLEGQLPFFDYHYPQMFLLPYVYAGWMGITGPSWYGARLLSALFAVTTGVLLFHLVWRTSRSRTAALLGATLFATSSLAFANLPTVKTYAFATLALFLAYTMVEIGPPAWRHLAAGVLLGLAIDVRLYLAAVVPVFALAAARDAAPRRELGRFGIGLALALAPNAFFYLKDPDVFVFNILGHHAVRSPAGLVGDLLQKVEAVLNMVGINAAFGATSFQFALVLLANLVWLAIGLARRQRPTLAVQIGLVVLLAGLIPTPTYGQYFTIFLPFVVVGAVELGVAVARELEGAGGALRRQIAVLAAVLVGAYVAVAPIDVWWFTKGGTIVPGVYSREAVQNWTIPTINAVGRAVDEITPPGARPVLSWWSGYFVETRTQVHPHLSNPNTVYLAPRLAPDQIERYKFMTQQEMDRQIRAREAPVVVLGNWLPPPAHAPYRNLIVSSGYVLARKIGDTEIYRVAY